MRVVSYPALNLLLAVIWMLLSGDLTSGNLLVGLGIGFLAIALSRPVIGGDVYVRAVAGLLRLLVAFTRDLVIANVQLARDVLRPSLPFEPGFIAFDVADLDRTQTVVLANLVSLTPGTLSVDLDDEGHRLFVHTIYAADPERVRLQVRTLADRIHRAVGDPPERPQTRRRRRWRDFIWPKRS